MKRMKHNRTHPFRPAALLSLLLACCLLLTSCAQGGVRRITFRYQSGTQDEDSFLYYSDSFFRHPSTEYDPSLATASLSFAMASFASIDNISYEHRYVNSERVLLKLGFRDIEANSDYHDKPDTDTFGVLIGSKKLDGATLLAVGLRGANYESEWASNFTVGRDDTEGRYHQGFYEASEIILQTIRAYVQDRELTGRLKIWISGYSRAGAACNVACGRLDEFIRDGESYLGENVQLAKEDLYAYCFEAPRGVYFEEDRYPKSDTFSNIFCIINPNDPVPKAVMEAMGFTRFGREILLPTTLSDLHFADSLAEISRQYGQLRSFGDWGTYRISDFIIPSADANGMFSLTPSRSVLHWTPAQYMDELLNSWADLGIGSRDYFVDTMQRGLRDLFHLVYLRKNTSASLKDIGLQFVRELLMTDEASVLIDDLIHNRPRLKMDATPIILRALDRMGLTTSLDNMTATFLQMINTLLYTIRIKPHLLAPLLSIENLKILAGAHYPELCLAYMRSMDPYYTDTPVTAPLDGKYYVLTAPPGTDVRVTQDARVIAAAENGLPQETEYPVPYGLWDGALRFILPAHESYTVTVSSDRDITLRLMDPGMLRETELSPVLTQTAEGYRFDISPAG